MTTPQLLTQMTRKDKALSRGEAGAFSWKEKPRAHACSSGEDAVDDLCRTRARTDFTDVASQLGSPHHAVTSCNANTQTELVTCNCNFKDPDEATLLPHHYVELTEDEFPDPAEVDGRYEGAVNRVSAEVASQHCETARVATEEAARAAAAMPQHVTDSQPAAASDRIPQHESSQNSTSFNDMRCRDGFEAWPAPKPSDFATRAAASIRRLYARVEVPCAPCGVVLPEVDHKWSAWHRRQQCFHSRDAKAGLVSE